MKYTQAQENRITDIKLQVEKIDKIKERLKEKISKIEILIDKERKKQSNLWSKIYKIDESIQKKCKHTNGTYKQINFRDDATYRYRVRCRDCETIVGHDEYNSGHY